MTEEMFNELKRFVRDTLELRIYTSDKFPTYVTLECDGVEVSRVTFE